LRTGVADRGRTRILSVFRACCRRFGRLVGSTAVADRLVNARAALFEPGVCRRRRFQVPRSGKCRSGSGLESLCVQCCPKLTRWNRSSSRRVSTQAVSANPYSGSRFVSGVDAIDVCDLTGSAFVIAARRFTVHRKTFATQGSGTMLLPEGTAAGRVPGLGSAKPLFGWYPR